MDNTTFPTSTTPATTSASTPSSIDGAAPTPAAPGADGLLGRVTQGAHDAVDGVAARLSSVTDGLGDTRDEWLESARDAVRQHPFAAVAGALVVGAALSSLRRSRD